MVQMRKTRVVDKRTNAFVDFFRRAPHEWHRQEVGDGGKRHDTLRVLMSSGQGSFISHRTGGRQPDFGLPNTACNQVLKTPTKQPESSFSMVLVLIIGDLYIPHRAHDLPSKFRKLLVPGKIQQILCTGNVCDQETYEYLRTVASDVCIVRGDYDENTTFPPSAVVVHPPIRVGIVHGHQCVPTGDLDVLSALARQMDVDVLVSGHTHTFQAIEYGGRFFVNPGSATGAWTGLHNSDPTPSFALMDIQGPVVVTYVYQLVEGEVRVEKIEYRKEVEVSKPVPSAPLPQTSAGYSAPTSPRSTQDTW